MLFTKKKQFSLTEKQIKQEMSNPEGKAVLRINLRYPCLQCPKNHKLALTAEPFYNKLAEGFKEYAENELLKLATAAEKQSPEDFLPFSALMRFENTFETEKYLSILLDVSVSNGKEEPKTERTTQVWDKTTGLKLGFEDFLTSRSVNELLNSKDKETKKAFNRRLFTLHNGFCRFYLKNRSGYSFLDVQI